MNCPKCGELLPENAKFCGSCGESMVPVEVSEQETAAPEQKPENVLTGIVGALIGAALGGGAIILLSQLGYVASISGLILAVCTLKGYELLGGRQTVKGIIICLALMLITPYIADRLDWAIVIAREFASEGVSFGQAFAAVPTLIGDGIDSGEYIKNLLMIYGFTALGAFGTIRGLFKKK